MISDRKLLRSDITEIIKEYADRNIKSSNKKVVMVDAKEIRKNKYDLSISRYKPVEHKTVQYEKPEALMDKVLSILEEEIVEFVRTIKKSV